MFAYRALCREIIVKETSKNLFLNLLKEGKYVPPKLLVGIEQGLKDLEDFKEKLDSMLLGENFNGIQTDLIIFKDEELKRVFIDNFQSILKYFEMPKVITTINNIINDKKITSRN